MYYNITFLFFRKRFSPKGRPPDFPNLFYTPSFASSSGPGGNMPPSCGRNSGPVPSCAAAPSAMQRTAFVFCGRLPYGRVCGGAKNKEILLPPGRTQAVERRSRRRRRGRGMKDASTLKKILSRERRFSLPQGRWGWNTAFLPRKKGCRRGVPAPSGAGRGRYAEAPFPVPVKGASIITKKRCRQRAALTA